MGEIRLRQAEPGYMELLVVHQQYVQSAQPHGNLRGDGWRGV